MFKEEKSLELKESELIRFAKEGDKDCMDKIFHQYKPLLYKLAKKYNNSPNDFTDVLQEGYMGLFRAILKYDESKNVQFNTFAYQCINNAILSAIRKNNSKENIFNKEAILLDTYNDDFSNDIDNLSPETFVINKEKEQFVKDEISNKLSELERQILDEFLNGLSYLEIAKKMNITRKSVDNALLRIRNKLKHLL